MSQLTRSILVAVCAVWMLGLVGFAHAQDGGVTLAVEAGYDGLFRDNQWMPLYITISNDSANLNGRLIVRPETSPATVSNAYSLALSLPRGSRKSAFLYIAASGSAPDVRVEFIDDEGTVVAAQTANLRRIPPRDALHLVFSGSAVATPDMTPVRDGGYQAYTVTWTAEKLPDRAEALNAVNSITIHDFDSATFTAQQRTALADWVTSGGHLIVTGGSSWQSTTAGFSTLLPFAPSGSKTVPDLMGVSTWLHIPDAPLTGDSVLTTGSLSNGGAALISAADGDILVARRRLGAGSVDFLAFDPGAQPLRDWTQVGQLWLSLATTLAPQPDWTYPISDWESAVAAVNILPGVNLLPDFLPMLGFLALYIVLIAPMNYWLLNRLNRREWAWVSVPLIIAAFTFLAWQVGFNLRGNEVTLSRLTVVQAWPDAPHARSESMIGLLSPRRAQYGLAVVDNFLRPIPRPGQFGNLSGGSEIQQAGAGFANAPFPVDASFIAPFTAQSMVEAPAISGNATLTSGENGLQTLRGSVRNDSAETLSDAVILAEGIVYSLPAPLEAGGVATFDLTLAGVTLPAPNPLSAAPNDYVTAYRTRSNLYSRSDQQSVMDILGEALYDTYDRFAIYNPTTAQEQEITRRRNFLHAMMNSTHPQLTGRGRAVYLAAWTNHAPLETTVDGANSKTLDTALYLVQLQVTADVPRGETRITADQFSWMVRDQVGVTEFAPMDLRMQAGEEVTFRFTPVPGSVLRQVNELALIVDRGGGGLRTLTVSLWNWDDAAWEEVTIKAGEPLVFKSPVAYLGPNNAVEVHIAADTLGSYPNLNNLLVEQRGEF